MKRTLKKFQVNKIALICLISLSSAYSQADQLDSILNDAFDSMTNVSDPTSFETINRKGWAAGGIVVKNKIFSSNIVSFSPPTASAGCGGISMYGGSLSYINKDQIVQLLRSVAANGKGLAFQMAIDLVSPTISKHIENFQKKIQQMNQFLGNSCQLSQGLLTMGKDAIQGKEQADDNLFAQGESLFDDMFSSWNNESATGNSTKAEIDSNPVSSVTYNELTTGNLLWNSFVKNDTSSWFGGTDNKILLESIMSLTGTIIVEPIPDGAATDEEKVQNVKYLLPVLDVEDLIIGMDNPNGLYACETIDSCLVAGTSPDGLQNTPTSGMADLILNSLLGTPTASAASGKPASGRVGGIVDKYANSDSATTLTSAEQNLMTSLPNTIGTMIVKLASVDRALAIVFVEQNVKIISVKIVEDMVFSLLSVAERNIVNMDHSRVSEMRELISESRVNVRAQINSLYGKYGKLSDITENYARLEKLLTLNQPNN